MVFPSTGAHALYGDALDYIDYKILKLLALCVAAFIYGYVTAQHPTGKAGGPTDRPPATKS